MGPDHPAVKKAISPCPKLEPSAIIVVAEGNLERSDSLSREPNSLALVVAEEPAVERLIPPCALIVGFGERHQRRLYETIELSGSSAPCERPEGLSIRPRGRTRPGPYLCRITSHPAKPRVKREA